MRSKSFVLLALLIILSMVLAACGGADEEPTPAPAPVEQPTAVPEPVEQPTEAAVVEPPTDGAAAPAAGDSVGASAEGAASVGLTCLADAYNGQMQGTVVSMNGPFTDEDQVKFESSVAAFEDEYGS